MINRTCRVAGCSRATTSRYGRFCGTHKARSRRHGGPEQKAVTKTELAPYERTARSWFTRNSSSPAWSHAADAWCRIEDHAKAVLACSAAGSRWEQRAAREVLTVTANVAAMDVLCTVVAMFLLQEEQPRRFSSDTAFRIQLTRRVRGLTTINAGEWTDHHGRRKLAYRELPPKAAMSFAHWTVSALGSIAVFLAKAERRKRAELAAERSALGDALAALR